MLAAPVLVEEKMNEWLSISVGLRLRFSTETEG